ncbi:lysine--tRNA ligase KRS1 [Sugiyamaella lignohabitans]|uniref:Lysine--tRNA ligase KRS1 n=1 Tax=Sugiyamaella lignohabitans TaxID=796027 RepID=A0A167FZ22_9ASCO|nr:lysine--tRNA ligase KRS1 [Sugiyamaella lignohabitans]ANB15888.1 lysine--tRNA ligase KRS1 [Sugiyamaella lignohabitans]
MQDFKHIQVVLNCRKLPSFDGDVDKFTEAHNLFRRGDIITATGRPWRTKSGEFSILASEQARLLSPCLHPLPTELNEANRLHNRVVDLSVNTEARDTLLARSTIISSVRKFFEERDFIEVQTPILSSHTGGATAEPFLTESRALSKKADDEQADTNASTTLSLRIAPELWLKRLVISGFDKVFEIGQCFRNEGIDASHNPEFTSCEFYQSYTSLEQLIEITQKLLHTVVQDVQKRHPYLKSQELLSTLAHQVNDNNKLRQIDFISEIESQTSKQLPVDLGNRTELLAYYDSIGLACPDSNTPLTASKLLDNLASVFLEPQCNAPTFIVNHPHVMSPLAKSTTIDINGIPRKVSRRFELFINGREYANAYEEENSPFVQRENFSRQAYDNLTLKDSESPLPDDSYVSAMEWGLPPTGGWGMGIDRLCMLLTGADRISQVLTFGSVKSVNYQ